MIKVPSLSCTQSFKNVFLHYCSFSGRARRSEYWYFIIVFYIILFILIIPPIFITEEESRKISIIILGSIDSILIIVCFIPILSVTVRRLHDTGRSGYYSLLYLIPIFGFFIILYFCLCDSQKEANKYGDSPKYIYKPDPPLEPYNFNYPLISKTSKMSKRKISKTKYTPIQMKEFPQNNT